MPPPPPLAAKFSRSKSLGQLQSCHAPLVRLRLRFLNFFKGSLLPNSNKIVKREILTVVGRQLEYIFGIVPTNFRALLSTLGWVRRGKRRKRGGMAVIVINSSIRYCQWHIKSNGGWPARISPKRPFRPSLRLTQLLVNGDRNISRGQNGRSVKLTTHVHLAPKLRMSAAERLLPLYVLITRRGTDYL
jgi:hypothetical protein